ncbi:MAG: hypothetical protein ACYC27_01015 [Armatimonadota bacterium]
MSEEQSNRYHTDVSNDDETDIDDSESDDINNNTANSAFGFFLLIGILLSLIIVTLFGFIFTPGESSIISAFSI